MKRKLITQMRTEWCGNLWLSIQFLIVSAVIWYVSVDLYTLYWLYKPSRGYDFEDIYVANLAVVPEGVPERIEYDEADKNEASYRELRTLVNMVRQNPDVEVVGTGTNALPYNYNYWGNRIVLEQKTDTFYYDLNMRTMDADAMRALRITGSGGESTESLISYLERGYVLLSEYDAATAVMVMQDVDLGIPEKFRGQTGIMNGKSVNIAPVLVNALRRSDFEPSWGGVMLVSPDNPASGNFPSELVIRIKHGSDREFMEWIQNAKLKVGNIYVSGTEPLAHRRDTAHQKYQIMIVRKLMIMAFMLILTFLGFLGTFWFRIQERVSDIAIRKSFGATHRQIGCRLWCEGYIVMALSTAIFAALALYVINSSYYDTIFHSPSQWGYYGMAITVAALVLMVFAGIYFPARKAMKINPATALKEQ